MNTAVTPDAAGEHVRSDGDATMCDVCGHELAIHDRIAERYCRATRDNALSRACICPTVDSPHPTYSRDGR
jgi:hypothetical protein